MKEFIQGATAPFRAAGFIVRHRLFALTGLCMVLHWVLAAALLAAGFLIAWPYLHQLKVFFETLWEGQPILATLGKTMGFVLFFLAGALLLALVALLTLVLGRVAAGPFLDLLSERVEEIATGIPAPAFSVGRVARGMGLALLDLLPSLALLAVFQGLVWLIGFIPVVGAVVSPILSVSGGAFFLAHEFLGLTLLRRFLPWERRWAFVFRHGSLSVGFGLACLVLLWVPFLNLMLLPLCATGGTLAVVWAEKNRGTGG